MEWKQVCNWAKNGMIHFFPKWQHRSSTTVSHSLMQFDLTREEEWQFWSLICCLGAGNSLAIVRVGAQRVSESVWAHNWTAVSMAYQGATGKGAGDSVSTSLNSCWMNQYRSWGLWAQFHKKICEVPGMFCELEQPYLASVPISC